MTITPHTDTHTGSLLKLPADLQAPSTHKAHIYIVDLFKLAWLDHLGAGVD